MDQQAVLARLEGKNLLDSSTSLHLTSNTVTNSNAQLCITTSQPTATSLPPLDPSLVIVQPVSGICVKQEYFEEESSTLSHQQVIMDQLSPHQIIETVEYNPNIVVKQEQFDDDTTLWNRQTEDTSNNEQTEILQVNRSVKLECHSPQNLHNIVNSVKLGVKEEYSDDEDGGCTQCDLKRELDFEGDEQMDNFHHQQVTEDPTNFIRPLVHFVPDQVPPHQIIETVQYNPNITIKQEQFDDDTTLSNGPSQTEYPSAIATTRSTSSSNEHNFVAVKEELKDEYCSDEHCDACGMKRKLDCEEVETGRPVKRQRSEQMVDVDGLIQEDHDTTGEGFDLNEGDQQGGDPVPAGNDQVNEGGQVIQHRVDQAVETENNFKCTFPGCDKEFKFKSKFTRHTRVHTGEKPFKCTWNGCDKAFNQNYHLQEHFRVHSGENPFKCSWNGCDKTFSHYSDFQAHMRVHTGEKPFECSWNGCDKAFAQSGNWRAHLRVHTGERPFACDLPNCGARFSQKSHLTRHNNRIHNRK